MNARRLIGLCLFATVSLAGTAFAQSQSVSGGIKGGINIANITGPSDGNKSQRIGGIVGGFLSFPVNEKMTFDPEVLYSMEGVKQKGTFGEVTEKVDFIRIPLLARFLVGTGPRAGYVLLGPSVGIVARAKSHLKGEDETVDFKDSLKRADVGMMFGVGAQVARFLVEARYTAGLTNLVKDSGESAHRSQSISLLVGAKF